MALRTWSSIAPWLTSPPSMWAMGMRSASATTGGGHHFIAIGDEKHEVGTPCTESVGEREDGDADGFGHAGISIGTEEALDARLDGKSFTLDFSDGIAEFRREMRTERDDPEFDFGLRGEFAERPIEMAVVGARGGDDGDFSFGFTRRSHRRPVSACGEVRLRR